MRKAVGGVGVIAAMLLAGTAMATQPTAPPARRNNTPFPPGQVQPNYETGANGVGASLQNPGNSAPNAGVTGVWPGSRDSQTGLGGNGALPRER